MQADSVKWFRKRLSTWAASNLRDFPWRRTTDPYSIFVAEFLLQKTTAATAAPIYEAFSIEYPNLKVLATAPIEAVAQLLQPLGLAFRAERLCRSAKIVVENYGGNIPASEEELLLLPGVGKYTARAICANAFGQSTAVLDTNVARIFERFFGLQGDRVKSRCKILWAAADAIAPDRDVGRWNLTLLDFGALVCVARKPRCSKCPLQQKCCHFNKIAMDRELNQSSD
ncbi:A/G-specific adenine glycosylase [Altericista sp. CCNU0014]|uniref:A/G-specific adenine glycosylase n=1 Tax=Altericista sp. CCNU0014 TaxID=3082949 RepID=UPI003850E138